MNPAARILTKVGAQACTGGDRTVEGGVDIDDVYNFAWFQYAAVSGVFRF